jgi:hypothetical protein
MGITDDRQLHARINAELTELYEMHPRERLHRALAVIEHHRHAMAAVCSTRAKAIKQLRDEGVSVIDIATDLGVVRQEVYRLAKHGEN